MELRNWIWTENDQALAEKWMDNLPDRMIDVHAHIYRMQDLGKQCGIEVGAAAAAAVK